jgi:hypothetical protein
MEQGARREKSKDETRSKEGGRREEQEGGRLTSVSSSTLFPTLTLRTTMEGSTWTWTC